MVLKCSSIMMEYIKLYVKHPITTESLENALNQDYNFKYRELNKALWVEYLWLKSHDAIPDKVTTLTENPVLTVCTETYHDFVNYDIYPYIQFLRNFELDQLSEMAILLKDYYPTLVTHINNILVSYTYFVSQYNETERQAIQNLYYNKYRQTLTKVDLAILTYTFEIRSLLINRDLVRNAVEMSGLNLAQKVNSPTFERDMSAKVMQYKSVIFDITSSLKPLVSMTSGILADKRELENSLKWLYDIHNNYDYRAYYLVNNKYRIDALLDLYI